MVKSAVTPDGRTMDSEGRMLYSDRRVMDEMTYANYVGGNTDGITGYYYGTEGSSRLMDGGTNDYTIYFGMAVKEIDANTIHVLSDQFDIFQPAVYHKTADGVYEVSYESETYKITFEGSNLILEEGFGYKILRSRFSVVGIMIYAQI